MADKLLIHGLTASCRLGVTDAERARHQPIGIDLELEINAEKAAKQDDVTHAVDYAALVALVKQLAEGKTYRLMETLAQDVAIAMLECGTAQAFVRITKRALPGIDSASVEVTRRKQQHPLRQ